VNFTFVGPWAPVTRARPATATAAAPATNFRRVAERGDRRHHQRRVQRAVGEHDQVADALLRGHELRHDHTDHGQGDGDLHAAEDMGQRMRYADLGEDLPSATHVGARHAQEILVDALEAVRGIDGHREEGDEEGEQQPRGSAHAEPDDEEWRDGDLGDDLGDDDDRVEAVSHDPGVRDQHRHHDATRHRDQEPEHDLVERGPQVLEQDVPAPDEHAHDDRRGRQHYRLHAERSHGQLP
jgi:hypothetical protein